MGQAAPKSRLSQEEYLAFERSSDQRHEYADGEIFAMAGGTREHNLAAGNVFAALHLAPLERPREVYSSDMRIKIVATGRYVYSDVSVACGRPEFEDETRDTLLNPMVIVEVLSSSTEAYDRGDKFAHYQTLPSFQEYVLVSQKEPRIEHFRRRPDGTWLLRILRSEDTLVLESIGCEVRVERVYRRVFDTPDAPEGSAAS